jgi:hypothetical protein
VFRGPGGDEVFLWCQGAAHLEAVRADARESGREVREVEETGEEVHGNDE